MTDLAKLLEQGERFVRDTLLTRGEKELTPFYHLVTPPGVEDALVPCQWGSPLEKDIMVAIVRGISRKIEAVAALFVCEAWAVTEKLKKGEPIPISLADYHPKGPPPSERPDRVEIVQIIATDGTDVKAHMLEIKRDWKGHIVALVGEKMSGADMFAGRMIDGIIPPRQVH